MKKGLWQTLVETLQDTNSQGSGKRLGGHVIIWTIAASVGLFFKTGKALPEYMFISLVSLGAALFGVTLFERKNLTTEQMMTKKPTDNEVKIQQSHDETGTPL